MQVVFSVKRTTSMQEFGFFEDSDVFSTDFRKITPFLNRYSGETASFTKVLS